MLTHFELYPILHRPTLRADLGIGAAATTEGVGGGGGGGSGGGASAAVAEPVAETGDADSAATPATDGGDAASAAAPEGTGTDTDAKPDASATVRVDAIVVVTRPACVVDKRQTQALVDRAMLMYACAWCRCMVLVSTN